MKKFLFKLSFFLTIPVGIVLLNVSQDPFHDVAPAAIEHDVVNSLLHGQKARVTGVINLRQVRKLQLAQLEQGGTLAVFGGSTMLEFGRQQLKPIDVQNFSVPNHSIEDQLALYQLYTSNKQVHCTHFAMGLSPYFFLAERSMQERWTPLTEEYLTMLSTLQHPTLLKTIDAELVQLKQLLSIDMARKSFASLLNFRERRDVMETNRPFIFPDGSWNKMSFSDSLGKTNSISPPTFNPGFSPTSQIDKEKLSLLFELLIEAKESHEKVFLLLSPYAPSFFSDITEQNKQLISLEQQLRALCHDKKIILIGSFDPTKLQLTDADFMDPIHWHPNSMSEYFKSIQLVQMIEESTLRK